MTAKSATSPALARRYVTALLDIAAGTKAGHTTLRTQLEKLAVMLDQSSDFAQMLASPLYSVAAQQRGADAVLTAGKFGDPVKALMRVVLKNRRGALLPAIVRSALAELDRRDGTAEADVTVASTLSAAHQKKLAAMLSTWSNKKVSLNVNVTPEVLGGIKIRLGSVQIDDSVSGKLTRLQQALQAKA